MPSPRGEAKGIHLDKLLFVCVTQFYLIIYFQRGVLSGKEKETRNKATSS